MFNYKDFSTVSLFSVHWRQLYAFQAIWHLWSASTVPGWTCEITSFYNSNKFVNYLDDIWRGYNQLKFSIWIYTWVLIQGKFTHFGRSRWIFYSSVTWRCDKKLNSPNWMQCQRRKSHWILRLHMQHFQRYNNSKVQKGKFTYLDRSSVN